MFEADLPSNKPAVGETSQSEEPLLKVACDKLSFTYSPSDEDERKHIAASLMDAKKDAFSNLVKYGSSSRYKINAILHTEAGAPILFQAQPTKSSDPPFRGELNPAASGASGIAEMKWFCETMFKHGWNSILSKGRVTRYDMALDVHGLHINELHFAPTSCLRTFMVVSQQGRIQTICYGSTKSRALFRIYDKAQQLKDTKKVTNVGNWTRIERSVRTGIPLAALEDVPNPFTKLLVTDLSFQVPEVKPCWLQIFKMAMRAEGGSAPFSQLPKTERKLIRDAMKQQAVYWWKPGLIFKMWGQHLKDFGLLTNQQGVHAKALKPGLHFGGG